jgi:nitrogen fixation NifU-like protein
MNDLYKEEILEHYKHPLHFGKLNDPTHTSAQRNPLCGDDISIMLNVEKNKIKDATFQGVGCAISIAAASILIDFSIGKEVTRLTTMNEEAMLQLLGIEVSEARKKCALLAFATLQDSLKTL